LSSSPINGDPVNGEEEPKPPAAEEENSPGGEDVIVQLSQRQ
jgi:hypothetical protein